MTVAVSAGNSYGIEISANTAEDTRYQYTCITHFRDVYAYRIRRSRVFAAGAQAKTESCFIKQDCGNGKQYESYINGYICILEKHISDNRNL